MATGPLSIKQIHQQLARREVSCKEVVQEFLNRVKAKDGEVHAYLEVDEEGATKQAEEIDEKIGRGEKVGELAGISFAVKDNILVKGARCTAGSKILENYKAPYDATVVQRLRDAGAIFIGKTNLDEFAMGSSTENSAFGPTRNPHDSERVPGGSSGGSAAAVAAGMCQAALGSDTGGSIRQPAAFCGVVGFKPTYGAISRYGLIAMASSLDQIGPIAKSVEDARVVFGAICGKDRFDATSLELEPGTYNLKPETLKIGIPKEYFAEGIDGGVKSSVEKAIRKYEKHGAVVKEVSLPYTKYGLAVYYIIMPSEVSANLARYDGIRYGASAASSAAVSHQPSAASDLKDGYMKVRKEGFGDEVRRRIILGTYTLSSGYYDAYYVKAQKVRMLIKRDFDKVFSQVDVIMTPATPTLPFRLGEKTKDPVSMYLSDVFTVGANLAGLPAIVLPCGWVEQDGKKLPVGLQIIGAQRADHKVLDAAEMYERFHIT